MVRQGEGKREKIKYELRDTGGNALESLNNTEVSNCTTKCSIQKPRYAPVSLYTQCTTCMNMHIHVCTCTAQ